MSTLSVVTSWRLFVSAVTSWRLFVSAVTSWRMFVLMAAACLLAPAEARVKYVTPDDRCAVKAADRSDCGWPDITADQCEDKGCCFDNHIWNTKWCFCKPVSLVGLNGVTCSDSLAAVQNCSAWEDMWCAAAEESGARVELTFPYPVLVTQLEVWQECFTSGQLRNLVIFSDGPTQTVALNNTCDADDGTCTDPAGESPQNAIPISPVVTTWVGVEVQDSCGDFNAAGLRDVQLIGFPDEIRCSAYACSPMWWYCPSNRQCDVTSCGCT